MLKLNIGCGDNKLEGFKNVDKNDDFDPDYMLDISKQQLPLKDKTVDEVWMMHTIEHIQKIFHNAIFYEFSRVLKFGGKLVLAYPEFPTIVRHYLSNYKGQREFWEATVYGRQSHPSDFHVCAMNSELLIPQLALIGFRIDCKTAESEEETFNTLVQCTKMRDPVFKEDLYQTNIFDEKKEKVNV